MGRLRRYAYWLTLQQANGLRICEKRLQLLHTQNRKLSIPFGSQLMHEYQGIEFPVILPPPFEVMHKRYIV
jgi:hypothetical protein